MTQLLLSLGLNLIKECGFGTLIHQSLLKMYLFENELVFIIDHSSLAETRLLLMRTYTWRIKCFVKTVTAKWITNLCKFFIYFWQAPRSAATFL